MAAKALLIVHQKTSDPGRIGRLLREAGYALDIRCPNFDDPLPETMDGHDAVVIFGGPMSANDGHVTPFFPTDFVPRMLAAVDDEGADMACAASGGRSHPVFGLWPVRLAGDLRRALEDEDMRKIDLWTARYRLVTVQFPSKPRDPFFNVNRPDYLADAERMLG